MIIGGSEDGYRRIRTAGLSRLSHAEFEDAAVLGATAWASTLDLDCFCRKWSRDGTALLANTASL
ncbi:hypothetical protein WI664_02690 [Vibrio cholerae]